MTLNLKKLQSIARRRIGLKGSFEFKAVPRSQVQALKLGSEFLSTVTDYSTLAHTIVYSEASSLDPADVFHEFCRAKLNECGFGTIEAAALNAMRDCSKEDPKYIRDANSALVVVSEVYASSLLFSKFKEEAESRRESIILRFESSDALTSLHTQMGLWGVAAVCYYRIASERAGLDFPRKQIEQAIARASDSKSIGKEYEEVNAILEGLPALDLLGADRISDSHSIAIVDVVVRLFSKKTGLEC